MRDESGKAKREAEESRHLNKAKTETNESIVYPENNPVTVSIDVDLRRSNTSTAKLGDPLRIEG